MFRNSGYWGLVLLVAVAFAFWPRYLSRPGDADAYTHVHAALMTIWCLLLVVQPFLVRARRLATHRALGRATYALVPAIAASALLLTHARMRALDPAAFRAEAFNFYLPLSMTTLFLIAYALAVVYRRVAPLHARFMLCTPLTAIDPVLGRILGFYLPPLDVSYQLLTFGLCDLILVALIVRERREPRARWAFPLMLAVFLAAHVSWFTLAPGESWYRFALWLRGLPLT